MKYYILIISFLFATISLSGQHLVQGNIYDDNKEVLVGATVVLLEPQDSSMVAFSISDNNGVFHLEDIENGRYVLQISFVSYRTTFTDITVEGDQRKLDIGSFMLEPTSEILQEVTVQAEHIPMGILGDTINYNAAAFQVRPGASVEDLLKKMPGIEVRRDGSIKAMGEDVENVLVDGKEFFGDDPKTATQNLDAEAVDKVQVFDKASEIAEFTGIDDGEEEKTINLKLKEGYKSGGFGNVEASGGTESRYAGKLNYNRFSPQMQAALILGTNNINKQAFSFNEYIQFMGGIGNAISSNNGMFNFGEFGRSLAPQGLTDNISSGLNFNYDFSKKVQLTSYYFYLRSDRNLSTTTTSNQFTESNDFLTNDNSIADRLNENHRIHVKLQFKPNPFTQVIWKNTFSGIFGSEESNATTLFRQENILTGETTSLLSSQSDQLGYEGNLQLRKKYQKKGRNWINTAKYQIGSLDEDNDVLNEYMFDSDLSTINQYQQYLYNKDAFTLSSAYTEPLGKQYYLGLRYSLDLESERPEKNFFDNVGGDRINNESLSANYKKVNTLQKTSLSLRKNAKKYKFNTALGIQWTGINGTIGEGGTSSFPTELDNNSTYLLPSASLEYELTKDKTLDISYNTSINLPTLSQLAPLPDNANPNLLILGNPNLSPEYNHSIRLSYSLLDQFNFKNLFFRANLNVIENQIINKVSIDEQLIKTLTPFNTDHYTQLSGYASYSAPIRLLDIKFRTSANYSWANYTTTLNNSDSEVKESNINYSFVLDNRDKDHVDIAAGIRMDYNIRRYDTNTAFNQQFFNYRLFIDGAFYIGNDWTITSKYDYVSYSGEFFSEGRTFHIWNTSIRKSFKEDKFAITLSINDALNQNRGIQRSGGVNSLYETRYNTLARYIMLGFKYKLGKKKKKEGISFG